MKKILLYIDMMGRGGAQRVMGNLADHFSEGGNRVLLVNDYPPEKDVPVYPVSDRVERAYLRKALEGNPLIKNLERIAALRKLVRAEKPDLILSFLGRPNLRMLVATLGMKTEKYVSVRNDPEREYGPGGFRKWFSRKLFNLADGCVFQTEEASGYFEEPLRKKSCVIPNPVAEKFFHTGRAANPRNIVTLGRMEKQKNQKLLIDAFQKIAADFPEEKLVICGDGPMREALQRQIADLHLKDRILLPGNVEDVPEILSSAKLFVLSSDYEGMPNALMEAMAVGVPCISTDCPCGGPRMLLEDHRQGLLVPAGDAEQLSLAMGEMLSEDALREEMGRAGKERSLRFRPEEIYRKWDAFLGLSR